MTPLVIYAPMGGTFVSLIHDCHQVDQCFSLMESREWSACPILHAARVRVVQPFSLLRSAMVISQPSALQNDRNSAHLLIAEIEGSVLGNKRRYAVKVEGG